MFIRIKPTGKPNKKKVQICESLRQGAIVKQVIVQHVGIAHDEKELEDLKRLANVLMAKIKEEREGPYLFPLEKLESQIDSTIQSLEADPTYEKAKVFETVENEKLIVNLNDLSEQRRVVEGFHDVFGHLFNNLGFHQILTKKKSEVLKELVLARIANPGSKRATQEMLKADFGVDISLDRIYRMMDALLEHQDAFRQKVFQSTQSLCFAKINMTFFDVTTLYFESVGEDDLRKFGYSKDQQFHSVQVVMALATTQDGLPIGYKCFPGNTAEVSTLLKCLDEWRLQLPIGEITVVADRAMMSELNLKSLEEAGIKYVIAAKLKKLPEEVRNNLLNKSGSQITFECDSYQLNEIQLSNNRRLIVTYSEKRAKKDKKDRERILEKVQKKIGKGKNVKKLISNRGYQKYLKTEGNGIILLDEEKLTEEEKWDGLHGIITNDHESKPLDLLGYYRRLWVIEESFKIHKTNLSIRPIYHFKPERIEAHILLCYLAFSLVRYTERRIEIQKEKMSIEEIRRELWRVQFSVLKDHKNDTTYRVPSRATIATKRIYQTFGLVRNEKIRAMI